MNSVAAVIWIVALIALACFYLVRILQRSTYTLWENVLYLPTYFYGRIVWRVHFTNAPPPELKRGAILVANHRSSVDPFFVQLSAGRRVHWMVAREYCENLVFGPILKAVQAIPTNRSGMDTGATKIAIRLAKAGKLVGMFPEGRLNHTKLPLVSIRPGAALIAARAGVPLLPLFIQGSPYRREVWSPLFMPARVRITFGTPIDPIEFARQNAPPSVDQSTLESTAAPKENESDKEDKRFELATAEAMMLAWGKQIVTLAGEPDHQIEIAGRSRLNRS